MKRMNKKGFTIVELVVVIAVIAILAAIMIPTFSGVTTDAKEKAALQEAKNVYSQTLASDLADNDTTNDVVYDKNDTIVVDIDGVLVSINANGEATVVAASTETTHTISNGKFVAKSN